MGIGDKIENAAFSAAFSILSPIPMVFPPLVLAAVRSGQTHHKHAYHQDFKSSFLFLPEESVDAFAQHPTDGCALAQMRPLIKDQSFK
jgi:hypothetical protein